MHVLTTRYEYLPICSTMGVPPIDGRAHTHAITYATIDTSGTRMNISLIGSIPLILLGLLGSGCEPTEENLGEELTACPKIRPEICTQEYDPVCALRKDGSHKTYSNGCSSCSDTEVVGYMGGSCK